MSEPSAVKPDALVQSTDGYGWENLRVLRVRHEPGELATPPHPAHSVVIHLTPAPLVVTSIDGRCCDKALRQGETAFIPARHAVVWRAPQEGACETLHIHIQSSFVRRTAADVCDVDPDDLSFAPRVGADDARINFISHALLHELGNRSFASDLYADSLARLLAVHLLREYATARPRVHKGGLVPYKLRRALDYIDDHLDGSLSVSHIAAALGMNPFHFVRTFKQATGCAPHRYVVKRRVERARRLLAETDMPIVEVALAAGFQNQSHFTKIFRRATGATPRAFRAGG